MKDSPLPDMFQKITEESTFLGKIASKIPGFSGYMEKSRRREADQLLRETISTRLEELRLRLSDVHQELSRDIIKAMDYAESLGEVDTRLMGLIGKIKDAPQGYAGFFDAVKVEADDLARVYEFDESMITFGDQLSEGVDKLQTAVMDDGDIAGTIRSLNQTAREANTTFNTRNQVLMGVG